MKKLFTLILLTAALAVQAQTVHNVDMLATSFSPADLIINVGDQVTWINNSGVVHTATSGPNCTSDGQWDTGDVPSGTSATITFNDPGAYDYYCAYHCLQGMVGTINVQTATGSSKAKASEIKLTAFPNPAGDQTTLSFTLTKTSELSVEVYDALGNLILTPSSNRSYSQGDNQINIPTAGLPEGAYFVKVLLNEENLYIHKFLKR